MTDPQPNPEVQTVSMNHRLPLPGDPDELHRVIDELRINVRMAADHQGITPFEDGESIMVMVTLQGLQEQE